MDSPDFDLVGGTIVCAEGSFTADLAVRDGRIAAVGTELPPGAAERVDVSGRLVMPGFVDAHTHIDMPFGTAMSDDWDSGTAAALAGGTTTIVDFAEQRPGGSLQDAIRLWRARAAGKARVDYGLHVIITDLSEAVRAEIPTLPESGVCSVKVFMAYKGTPLFMRDDELFEVMQIAAGSGLLVMVHAENGDVIESLRQQALDRGDVSPVWHARTRPHQTEAEATSRAVRMAQIAAAPLVVVHVTCASALEEIRRARSRGATVFAETCPQYLVLDRACLQADDGEGAKYVCSPPLRTTRDQRSLWRALGAADVTLVGSDHSSASFHRQKRVAPDFAKIPNGVPGVQERPALLWTHGVLGRRISADQFVAVVSTNPARIHRMYPRKGTLAPGADADVVVWDPGGKTVVSLESSHSRADYSPYEQMTLTGAPERVYLRGALAYRNGEVLAPAGSGEFVHRATSPPAWESSEDSSGFRGGQSAMAESAV